MRICLSTLPSFTGVTPSRSTAKACRNRALAALLFLPYQDTGAM